MRAADVVERDLPEVYAALAGIALLELANEPIETGTGKNKATVLANIPLLPLPNSTS